MFTAAVQSEVYLYIGTMLFAILYGLYSGIVYLSISAIFSSITFTGRRRAVYISYGIVLWLLNTLSFLQVPLLSLTVWGQSPSYGKYVDSPVSNKAQHLIAGWVLVGSAAENLAIFLNGALLIYRCYIINGSKIWIIMPLALSSVGFIVISMASVLISSLQSSQHHIESVLLDKLTFAGIILIIFIDTTTTVIISIRILTVFYSVRKYANSKLLKPYISVVVILVESAAPCTILGIFAVVTQSHGYSWGSIVSLMWWVSLALFPQLTILRIAQGNAWTRTTAEELTHAANSTVFVPEENVPAAPDMQFKV